MSKLSELRNLMKISEQYDNDTIYNCLVSLMQLSAAELIEQDTYDDILGKIKLRMENYENKN